MGTGTGARAVTRAVAEMGSATRMGTWTRSRNQSGSAEEGRRTAIIRIIVVDATWHFHSARLIIFADRGYFRAPDSSARKAR